MAQETLRENKMGTMPENKLLLSMAVPMMISMLVQALYNVVDSVFVSHVSESALTAVSLAFSLQNVMIAVGVGTGVGVNALLSKSLGEKNQSRANATAENGIFLSLCSFAVFFVIGLTCMKPYFYAQTSDAVIAQQGIRYLSVCCIFSLGLFTQTMGEKLLAATGRTQLSMISQLVGAVVNIILDPIFIFGYCGQALSGTTGAAVATVIGQFCGAGMTLYFNTRKNPDIQISFKGFRPSAKAIGRIYTVGLPSIAMQCVGSLMTFGMNLILMAFSATAVAVFGVYFKLQSFVFMPIFGMNNGMVPIIGYNYGARKPDRVKKTIKLAMCYAEGIMLIGFCLFQFALISVNRTDCRFYICIIGVTASVDCLSSRDCFINLCVVRRRRSQNRVFFSLDKHFSKKSFHCTISKFHFCFLHCCTSITIRNIIRIYRTFAIITGIGGNLRFIIRKVCITIPYNNSCIFKICFRISYRGQCIINIAVLQSRIIRSHLSYKTACNTIVLYIICKCRNISFCNITICKCRTSFIVTDAIINFTYNTACISL